MPAGNITSWHVEVRTPHNTKVDAWYAKEAPHLLVRLHDPQSGTAQALRSWRASPEGELHGQAEELSAQEPTRPAPLNVPLSFTAAPWTDGETSRYDMLDARGNFISPVTWTIRRSARGGSMLKFKSNRQKSEVVLDADLRPFRYVWEGQGKRVEAAYTSMYVYITMTGKDGSTITKSIERPPNAIDNSVGLQIPRALPLRQGYAASYIAIVAKTGIAAPLTLEVVGEESVAVPAGNITSWHVEIRSVSSKTDAWYAKEAPHLLVRFHDPAGGGSFALRSWRASPEGELHGAAEEPSVVKPAPPEAADSAKTRVP